MYAEKEALSDTSKVLKKVSSPISETMNQLYERTSKLMATLLKLRERLSPVLAQSPEKKSDPACESSSAPHHASLLELASTLNDAQDIINGIANDLVL